MKAFTRLISAAVALSAGLFLAGCTTTVSRAPSRQPVVDFVVVESSTEKELTPEQLAEIRRAVLKYLQDEGLTDGRRYYVKVLLPAESPTQEPQWAVVRIGGNPAQNYTVVAAYPGSDDYYPYDYSGSGYFNRGYFGFSRYDHYDPYFADSGKYYPPIAPTDPVRPHQPNHKRDHPPGTHTRWNYHPRTDGDQPRSPDTPPLSPDKGHRKRDHDPDHGRPRDDYPPRPAGGGSNRDYTPSEPRSSPAPSYTAPSAEASHRESVQSRDERRDPPQNEK